MEWIYKYISLTAIMAALWFLVRYLIQKKIDSYFNKRLETYKHELTIITENAKYDISKKLYDFEAYASKRHVVYPELYSLAFEIWTELRVLIPEFNKEDKMVLDKDALKYRFYDKSMSIANKLDTAFDDFYKNELYLSKNTAVAYEGVIRIQFSLFEEIRASLLENLNDDNWQDPDFSLIKVDQENYDRAKEKLSVLKEIIYKELSYTHSEEVEQKEEALS